MANFADRPIQQALAPASSSDGISSDRSFKVVVVVESNGGVGLMCSHSVSEIGRLSPATTSCPPNAADQRRVARRREGALFQMMHVQFTRSIRLI